MNLVDEGSTAHGTALGGAGLEECLIGPTVHWGDLCYRVVGQQVAGFANIFFPIYLGSIDNSSSSGGSPTPTVSSCSVCEERKNGLTFKILY